MNDTSLSTYPPQRTLQSSGQTLVVLQLTDLHIRTVDLAESLSSRAYAFRTLLTQALTERPECHLIIVTGDLIHDMNAEIYDWVFSVLEDTKIPFVCLSGNHDVTDEVGDALNFYEQEFVPYEPDPRLLTNHVVESEFWQLLFIDSSVSGKVSGYIDDETLNWITAQLSSNPKPAILCLHHHLLPVQSKWIDDHITLNYEEFWQQVVGFKHLKATVGGHVHQECCAFYEHVANYSTPATSYQFMPKQDNFTLDDTLPGYRWLLLSDDGLITSEVKRLHSN